MEVAQLAERSLPTLEDMGLNTAKGNFYQTFVNSKRTIVRVKYENKEKRGQE